jgi:hypothetical protein
MIEKPRLQLLGTNCDKNCKLSINVPVVYKVRAVRNDFETGNIHYEGHWKGWDLEIKTFLSPEMATSEQSAIWAQKKRLQRPTQWPNLPVSRSLSISSI